MEEDFKKAWGFFCTANKEYVLNDGMKFYKICIFGLGFIGLSTACPFSSNGIKLTAIDVNSHGHRTLRRERFHVHKPVLNVLVSTPISS